jgi:phenazine biosynthesis protein phzE
MGEPAQGVQRTIVLSGSVEPVGSYHTYAAVARSDSLRCPFTGDPVRILRDLGTGIVQGLSKPWMRSIQFHVESVLTENGAALLRAMLIAVVTGTDDLPLGGPVAKGQPPAFVQTAVDPRRRPFRGRT